MTTIHNIRTYMNAFKNYCQSVSQSIKKSIKQSNNQTIKQLINQSTTMCGSRKYVYQEFFQFDSPPLRIFHNFQGDLWCYPIPWNFYEFSTWAPILLRNSIFTNTKTSYTSSKTALNLCWKVVFLEQLNVTGQGENKASTIVHY